MDERVEEDRPREEDPRSGSPPRAPHDEDRPERAERGEKDNRPERQGSTCSLLVRNLSYNVRSEEIKRIMVRYGEVRDVYIPTDFYSKRPRGFAFVEFFDKRDATAALENLDRYEMDGREISIVFAKDRRKSAEEMRPRRGDSRDRGRGGRRGGSRDRRGSPSRSRSRDRRDRRGSPPRRGSSPAYRRGSPPRRRADSSPPRRRADSSPPRRGASPPRRGSPPRRRASPSRSPSV